MTTLEKIRAEIDCYLKNNEFGTEYRNDIKSIIDKYAEQEPKTGHWVEKDGFDGDVYYDCSECGESWTTIEGTPWQNGMDYCPNCGAKMAESEDKE